MSQPTKIPSSDFIQASLAGKIHPVGIDILQGIAKAQREGRKVTEKYLRTFAAVQRSWFYEVKRMLILAGYLDEDGKIYLPSFEETQAEIARRVYAMASEIRRRRQPKIGTVQRTLIKSLIRIKEEIDEERMASTYGPAWKERFDAIESRC